MNQLQGELKAAKVLNSYQVTIDLKGSDPAKTAAIVNAVANSYLTTVHKETSTASDQRAQLLDEERQRIVGELQTARTEQAALSASIGVANFSAEGGNPYDAELAGIRMQLIEARAAHEAAAAQLSSLSGVGPGANGLTAAADEVVAGDSGLNSMKAMISQRRAILNGQMAGMTPTNPIYKVNQEEIAELDKTLDSATNELRKKAAQRVQDKLRTDLQRTGDVEARLNGELSRQILHATSAGPKLQRASEVTADIVRLDARAAAVDDALRALRLDQNGPGQVRIAMPAAVPANPEPSKVKLLLLAALPLALLLGGFAAVLARKRDQRIYEETDIGDVLGFPPLAVLPARNDVAERVFEEYVLRLAAGIESAYRNGGARTFLLTAVSLTTDIAPYASALRRKFEQIGVNVVVATAPEMLSGGEVHPGFAIVEHPDASTQSSEGFVGANMARLKAGHGLVLIESEALLNCGQTEYVARCADATILLVESGVTTRHELYCAAELLERMQVTGIGAVLAELQLRFADSGFRTAIASLERRLSAQARPIRVPELVEQRPVAETRFEASREAEVAEIHQEPDEPIRQEEPAQQPVNLLTLEPADTNVRAFEVAAESPESVEWQLPAIAASAPVVEAVEEVEEEKLAPAAPIRRGFGTVGAVGPVLVETGAVPPVQQVWENFEEEPALAKANGTMHEKIAPKLSANRDVRASNGDAGMTRKASWLGRLLGRDEGPRFSIIPDAAEDAATPAEAIALQAAAPEPEKSQEYDLPLAARLEQISRQRPAAPLTPPTIFPAKNSRLQIVPDPGSAVPVHPGVKAQDEPIETALEEAALPELEPVAVEPEPVVDAPLVETPSVAPAISEEPVRRLPRPLSFYQLQRAAEVAPVAAAVEEHEPVHEFVEPDAAVEEIAEPAAEMPEMAPEHVEKPSASEPEVETAPVDEAALEARLEPEHVEQMHGEPIPDSPVSLEPARVETLNEEPVEDSNQYEVEPVYEEASRHLTGGRWDPIPPLRSTGSGWRDRPSPVPASNPRPDSGSTFGYDRSDPLRRRWTGKDQEADQPTGVATQTEPLPEPVLTRQWGLLSKFQQARASGSRPVTSDPAARDHDDAANGNGRRQS